MAQKFQERPSKDARGFLRILEDSLGYSRIIEED